MTGDPRRRRIWVLNLDAEEELTRGLDYASSRRVQALVRAQAQRLIGGLVDPADRVLWTQEDALEARQAAGAGSFEGLAWSPTPQAQALLALAGAATHTTQGASQLSILQEVNARPFAAGLHEGLASGPLTKEVVLDEDRARVLVSRPAPRGWLARRIFGAAGRARRRFLPHRPERTDLPWLRASLALGPLVIEPWVEVLREFTRSGWINAGGDYRSFSPGVQHTDRAGAWTNTESPDVQEIGRAIDRTLEQTLAHVAEHLVQAGYRGPFGIDAFLYSVGPGTGPWLNPLSEINARFTMDFPREALDKADFALL